MNPSRWPLVAVLLTACGHVSNPEDIDARPSDGGGPDASGLVDAPTTTVDAPPGASDLGVLCSDTCVSGHQCVVLGLTGSSTAGYCSPPCTESGGECAVGYSGPMGGQPECAVTGTSGQPEFCAILCTTADQCPNGLACTAVPDQGFSVCDAQP